MSADESNTEFENTNQVFTSQEEAKEEGSINLRENYLMDDDSHLLTITERTLEDSYESLSGSEVSMSQMMLDELKNKLNARKGQI